MSIKVGNAEIIQRNVRRWISRVGKLDKVKYNKSVICFNDINVFISKKRSKNDTNNKKEKYWLYNQQYDARIYKFSLRRSSLKNEIDNYKYAMPIM